VIVKKIVVAVDEKKNDNRRDDDDDDDGDVFYDYDNANDVVNTVAEFDNDNGNDNDDRSDNVVGVGAGAPVIVDGNDDEKEVDELEEEEGEKDLNLIAEPRKIEKLQIKYEKKAKVVDVKVVKATMWSLLTGKEQDEAEEESTMTAKKTLSALCQQLPPALLQRENNTSNANNVSVSIAFICLLHLANEKCLAITDQDDMKELHIHQGTTTKKK